MSARNVEIDIGMKAVNIVIIHVGVPETRKLTFERK